MSDSLTERQKIDRCASAKANVSSKMSRWKKTENQPSSEILTELHVAIVALHHEGIGEHDEERPDRRDEDDDQCRRRQQPAVERIVPGAGLRQSSPPSPWSVPQNLRAVPDAIAHRRGRQLRTPRVWLRAFC